MEIKRLDTQDVERLTVLFDAYRQFYKKESSPDRAKIFLTERLQRQEAIVFGAEIDGNLIGFTLLYPLFSSVRMQSFYLLNDLFVEPQTRNKSVGLSLLNHAKQFAREQGKAGLMLETEKTNDTGNYLYPKAGFELIDGSNFYFWENQV